MLVQCRAYKIAKHDVWHRENMFKLVWPMNYRDKSQHTFRGQFKIEHFSLIKYPIFVRTKPETNRRSTSVSKLEQSMHQQSDLTKFIKIVADCNSVRTDLSEWDWTIGEKEWRETMYENVFMVKWNEIFIDQFKPNVCLSSISCVNVHLCFTFLNYTLNLTIDGIQWHIYFGPEIVANGRTVAHKSKWRNLIPYSLSNTRNLCEWIDKRLTTLLT